MARWPRPGRIYAAALLALFAAVAAVSLGATVLGRTELPWAEKRRRAPMPPLPATLAEWEAWPARFERYFDDGFGLRATFLSVNSLVASTLLGRLPTDRVIEGRDGWLYFAGDRSIELFRRTLPLPRGDLDIAAAERKRRATALAARGIGWVVTIAPDKHTVHPEHMPAHIVAGPGASQYDQFAEAMARAGVDGFVDLRPVMARARASGVLYRSDDTHWNLRGARVAFEAIAAALYAGRAETPPRAAALAPEEIEAEPGDLAVMAGVANRIRVPTLASEAGCAGAGPRWSEVVVGDGLRGTRSLCPGMRHRLLFFGDSFGDTLKAFLARGFAEVVVLPPAPTFAELTAAVDAEKPDFVVEERVERRLQDFVDASLRSMD